MLSVEEIKEELGDRNLREVAKRTKLGYSQVWGLVKGGVTHPTHEVVEVLSNYLTKGSD